MGSPRWAEGAPEGASDEEGADETEGATEGASEKIPSAKTICSLGFEGSHALVGVSLSLE